MYDCIGECPGMSIGLQHVAQDPLRRRSVKMTGRLECNAIWITPPVPR